MMPGKETIPEHEHMGVSDIYKKGSLPESKGAIFFSGYAVNYRPIDSQ